MRTVLKNSCPLVMVLCLLVLTISLGEALAGKIGPESGLSTDRKLPKLIDLGAKKCIPCKMMAPILDELTKEYKGVFEVEFIDVWQPENKGKALAHGIRSIPTQIFLDASGKSLFRHEGFISKEDILKKWKELGFTFLAVQEEEDKKSSSGSESE